MIPRDLILATPFLVLFTFAACATPGQLDAEAQARSGLARAIAFDIVQLQNRLDNAEGRIRDIDRRVDKLEYHANPVDQGTLDRENGESAPVRYFDDLDEVAEDVACATDEELLNNPKTSAAVRELLGKSVDKCRIKQMDKAYSRLLCGKDKCQ